MPCVITLLASWVSRLVFIGGSGCQASCYYGFYLKITSKVRDAIFHFATTVLGIRGVDRGSSGSAAGGFRDGDTRAVLR